MLLPECANISSNYNLSTVKLALKNKLVIHTVINAFIICARTLQTLYRLNIKSSQPVKGGCIYNKGSRLAFRAGSRGRRARYSRKFPFGLALVKVTYYHYC